MNDGLTKVCVVAAAVLAVGFAIYFERGSTMEVSKIVSVPEKVEMPKPPPVVQAQPAVQQPTSQSGEREYKVHFSGASEDGLPVGVWSEIVKVPIGCSIKWAAGDSNEMEHRYYSREWKKYESGTSPDMSEVRFRVFKEGITEIPYKVKCP